MKTLYQLYHYYKILEDEEVINSKALGIFTSKEQVYNAIRIYQNLPGFRDQQEVFDGDEYGEGFFISPMPVGISYWDGGFFTYSGDTNENEQENQEEEDIEIILNLPPWFKNIQAQPSEINNDFAERVMQQKYNTTDYPRDPQSEFYQIKKYIELRN